jgi:hypothetical protein
MTCFECESLGSRRAIYGLAMHPFVPVLTAAAPTLETLEFCRLFKLTHLNSILLYFGGLEFILEYSSVR